MSVINRMLEDLEQRRQRPADADRDLVPPGQGGHGARRPVIAVVLAAVLSLLAVAALAWWLGGKWPPAAPRPDKAAAIAPAQPVPAGTSAPSGPSGERPAAAPRAALADQASQAAEASEATEATKATEAAPEPSISRETDAAVLRQTDTRIGPGGARIALSFDRPLDARPSVRDDGRRRELRLPGARIDGDTLAFLAGLEAAGQLESSRDEQGTSLSIEPAEGSRLEVEADRHGIVLTFSASRPASGTEPRAPSSSTDGEGAARKTSTEQASTEQASIEQTSTEQASTEQASTEQASTDRGTAPSSTASAGGRAHAGRSEPAFSPETARRAGKPASEDTPSMGIRPASASLRERLREALDRGDTDAAREQLRAALSDDPSRQDLWRLLAKLDMRDGQDGQAVERLAALARPEPATRALLGLAARRAGQPELAIRAYVGALEAHPDRADWWAGLGIARESAGRPGPAVSAYRRAIGAGGLSEELTAYVRQRLAALTGVAENSDRQATKALSAENTGTAQ